MKYNGSMVTVWAIVFAFIIGAGNLSYPFGFTESEKDVMNLQTFTVSDFGDNIDQSNRVVWVANFSRFAVQDPAAQGLTDPLTNKCYVEYMEGKPMGLPRSVDKDQKWCLGVKAAFIKQSYNWIEVFPVKLTGDILGAGGKPVSSIQKRDKKPADNLGGKITNDVTSQATNLNLEGVVKSLDLWVWGGNYKYWIEFYLQDFKGFLHRLPAGDIKYVGWMNLRTKIPTYIPQTEPYVPFMKNLKLIMIKIWSYPTERVDQFYTYFDYMQVQTDVYVQRFNGDDLAQGGW